MEIAYCIAHNNKWYKDKKEKKNELKKMKKEKDIMRASLESVTVINVIESMYKCIVGFTLQP